MSVIKVIKIGEDQYDIPSFKKTGVDLGGLAKFIDQGHEIEVNDRAGKDVTKQTLVNIALSISGLPDISEEDRVNLFGQDEFRLHQMIEDQEVSAFLRRP
jgi:hypothetical protein